MGIAITFRHLESTDAIKAYVTEKLERVQKYLRVPLDARVTLFMERHEHVAEIHITSGGKVYQARHDSEDMYKSIDFVIDKIEAQISKHHDAQSRNKKGGDKAGALGSTAPVPGEEGEG